MARKFYVRCAEADGDDYVYQVCDTIEEARKVVQNQNPDDAPYEHLYIVEHEIPDVHGDEEDEDESEDKETDVKTDNSLLTNGNRFVITGLHVSDWETLLDKAFTITADDKPMTVKFGYWDTDNEEDIDATAYITGSSASGIRIWTRKNRLHVHIPWMASPADIVLCFNGLLYIDKNYPDAKIYETSEDNEKKELNERFAHEADFSEEASQNAFLSRLDILNMLIHADEETFELPGIRRPMILTPKFFQEKLKGLSDNEKIEKVLNSLIDLQWLGEVEPKSDLKVYLMRWNPEISNFKVDDFNALLEQFENGEEVALSWSVYDYMQMLPGDECYMMCVGGTHKGIVLHGIINSFPIHAGDWSGRGRETYYANILIDAMKPVDEGGLVSEQLLTKEVSSTYEWSKGHSGVVLDRELSDRLNEVIDDTMDADDKDDKDSLYIEVNQDTMESVKAGQLDHLSITLTEDNKKNLIVAHDNGIMLNTDELPIYSYGAYLYNEGKFPYVLNPIKEIHMTYKGHDVVVDVKNITTEATNRFRFDDELKQSVEDPQGLGCMWVITYHF